MDPLAQLVGAGLRVPCLDGVDRVAVELDQAASTQIHPEVASRVEAFLPRYSSVHRGAGFRSRQATASYEEARRAVLAFAGRTEDGPDVAILCRNTTEAINHLSYRLRLEPADVVVTTVVEHHANLLPWGRVARRRYVECSPQGTFGIDDVAAALDAGNQPPALLALTGASNVSGWLPPLEEIIEAAHERGVPVVVDAAQLAPHRPFLAGGGAVDLVDLDEVIWTTPPDREEAGSPNVIGTVALHAAIDALRDHGWRAIVEHERALAKRLVEGLEGIDGVRILGPTAHQRTGTGGDAVDALPVVPFVVEGAHHALIAARLSAEFGIAVRHGCFCAHPYVVRLLGLTKTEVDAYRSEVLGGDHRNVPGAVRASAGLGTSASDIDALLAAVTTLAAGGPPPVPYRQDPATGDYVPETGREGWRGAAFEPGAACSRG